MNVYHSSDPDVSQGLRPGWYVEVPLDVQRTRTEGPFATRRAAAERGVDLIIESDGGKQFDARMVAVEMVEHVRDRLDLTEAEATRMKDKLTATLWGVL